MDAVLLARIQFAFTIAYHFIFVPMSIGLSIMMVAAERRYYKSDIPADKAATKFWIRLFTTTFAIGVATGITMEFAFGTNWANYSRFVGNIFGAPLAAEGLFAFFLESVFLGVLLFGRDRVSKRLYYVSTWLVMCGALLSALWILIANSWMQTPAGYKVVNGKAILTDFWAAALNPSIAQRYTHTIAACIIAGAFIVAAIGAWYLLKGRHVHMARHTLRTGLIVGLIFSAAMPLIGHWSATEVAKYQPVKMAAFENVGQTADRVPMYLFGVTNGAGKTTGVSIPSGLSLLLGFSPDHVVTGLDSVPAADRPPEQMTFQAWHLMIALSGLFVVVMLIAVVMLALQRIEKARWVLWLLVICSPLPLVAIFLGWAAAEVGRQPWIVQGLMRTTDGVSPVVSSGQIWMTLGLFGLIYLVLFIGWWRIFFGTIRKGPEEVVDMLTAEKTAATPAPAGAGR
ncbi:MAG TPA: cytochrome ubiquinol oxidase subunit I [Thermoleophilia bacterium]|nr:cytochrome ubiquinol oxidase subunit I [Thermoleophilia bacterium]